MRATLKQIQLKPLAANRKGEIVHDQYANINFQIDLSEPEGQAEIMKLMSFLDSEEVVVTVAPIQKHIEFDDELS